MLHKDKKNVYLKCAFRDLSLGQKEQWYRTEMLLLQSQEIEISGKYKTAVQSIPARKYFAVVCTEKKKQF